jgi:threonine dehydrogenase-like Zn-dependent dehydrogenase
VYSYGPHSQYFKINTTDRWHGLCVKLPEGIDPVLASFAHMAGIAATAIRTSSIELGDDVLVTGMGAIGNLAAQLARLQGANVIGADINEKRIWVANQCGIEQTINNSLENLLEFVALKTSNRMVSTYIDATGSAKVISQTADMLALYGETILLGSPRAAFETNLASFMQHFHYLPWCQTLKGALEFTYPTHPVEFVKHSIERNARINLDLIRSGRLIIKPLLSHVILPSEIQSAYDGLRNHPDEYFGVVIDWTK